MNSNALSHTLSNGITVINHAAYQKSLKSKTESELRWIIKDATEAMTANPDGHKAGFYADEVSYCAMEITRRRKETNAVQAAAFADAASRPLSERLRKPCFSHPVIDDGTRPVDNENIPF